MENNSEGRIPQFRTIPGTVKFLRSMDEECAITESTLRTLIRDGTLRYKKIGRRILVDVNSIYDWFYDDGSSDSTANLTRTNVRRNCLTTTAACEEADVVSQGLDRNLIASFDDIGGGQPGSQEY